MSTSRDEDLKWYDTELHPYLCTRYGSKSSSFRALSGQPIRSRVEIIRTFDSTVRSMRIEKFPFSRAFLTTNQTSDRNDQNERSILFRSVSKNCVSFSLKSPKPHQKWRAFFLSSPVPHQSVKMARFFSKHPTLQIAAPFSKQSDASSKKSQYKCCTDVWL